MYRKNIGIIYMVIDSLRYDYGDLLYSHSGLSRYRFLSLTSYTTATYSAPAHTSLLTGLPPCLHGVYRKSLDPSINDFYVSEKTNRQMLQNILSKYGYITHLYSANPYISPGLGYRGFSIYVDLLPSKHRRSFISYRERKVMDLIYSRYRSSLLRFFMYLRVLGFDFMVRLLMDKYIVPLFWGNKDWPRDKGGDRFRELFIDIIRKRKEVLLKSFIFVNLMEVHEPYLFDDDLRYYQDLVDRLAKTDGGSWERYIEAIVDPLKQAYRSQVVRVASILREILYELYDAGILDDMLVIITSDHGQLLGEYGMLGHINVACDEMLRVPLFLKLPNNIEDNDIYRKINNDSECIVSHLKIPRLIKSVAIDNKAIDICDDIVFSELYGRSYKDNGRTVHQITKKPIVFAYGLGYKALYDMNSNRFIELTKTNGSKNGNEADQVIRRVKRYVALCRGLDRLRSISPKTVFRSKI